MLLCELEKKSKAKITKILKDKDIILKLSSMGIRVGAVIEMIKNDRNGPVILSVNKNKLILGRGFVGNIEIIKL